MTKPVCSTCNDTHFMDLHDFTEGVRRVPCTRCPVPCRKCRQKGTGPYCGETPCSCECHKPKRAIGLKVAWWKCTVSTDLVVRHGVLPHVSVLTINKHLEKCPEAKFITKRIAE